VQIAIGLKRLKKEKLTGNMVENDVIIWIF